MASPKAHRHRNEIGVQLPVIPGFIGQIMFDDRFPDRVWLRHWDGKSELRAEFELAELLVLAPRMMRAAMLQLEESSKLGGLEKKT